MTFSLKTCLRTCANPYLVVSIMQEGKAAINLSIDEELIKAAKTFVISNKRKGRANLSEFTASLWISYLREKGTKLPPLLKNNR
jgi:hypothetical protein